MDTYIAEWYYARSVVWSVVFLHKNTTKYWIISTYCLVFFCAVCSLTSFTAIFRKFHFSKSFYFGHHYAFLVSSHAWFVPEFDINHRKRNMYWCLRDGAIYDLCGIMLVSYFCFKRFSWTSGYAWNIIFIFSVVTFSCVEFHFYLCFDAARSCFDGFYYTEMCCLKSLPLLLMTTCLTTVVQNCSDRCSLYSCIFFKV